MGRRRHQSEKRGARGPQPVRGAIRRPETCGASHPPRVRACLAANRGEVNNGSMQTRIVAIAYRWARHTDSSERPQNEQLKSEATKRRQSEPEIGQFGRFAELRKHAFTCKIGVFAIMGHADAVLGRISRHPDGRDP